MRFDSDTLQVNSRLLESEMEHIKVKNNILKAALHGLLMAWTPRAA